MAHFTEKMGHKCPVQGTISRDGETKYGLGDRRAGLGHCLSSLPCWGGGGS